MYFDIYYYVLKTQICRCSSGAFNWSAIIFNFEDVLSHTNYGNFKRNRINRPAFSMTLLDDCLLVPEL